MFTTTSTTLPRDDSHSRTACRAYRHTTHHRPMSYCARLLMRIPPTGGIGGEGSLNDKVLPTYNLSTLPVCRWHLSTPCIYRYIYRPWGTQVLHTTPIILSSLNPFPYSGSWKKTSHVFIFSSSFEFCSRLMTGKVRVRHLLSCFRSLLSIIHLLFFWNAFPSRSSFPYSPISSQNEYLTFLSSKSPQSVQFVPKPKNEVRNTCNE